MIGRSLAGLKTRPTPDRRPGLRTRLASGLVVGAVACGVTFASAQALPSREQALALAYPGATVEAHQVFLTEAQMKAAAARAGEPIPSALVARYTATRNGTVVGRAYIDTHVVRTKKESVVVALDAAGAVKRVEVVAFVEPPEYRAPEPFLGQFTGRRLDAELRLQRAVRPIAGATLTSRALTNAVRRVLAIDEVLTTAPQDPRR
jgi:hypothetical protein